MKVFSCDLSDGSKKHVAFLQKLREMGVMTAPVTQQSIDRYLHCWLPLLADVHRNSNDSRVLLHPPDVAWLSHCHRLATGPYRKYLLQQFQDDSIDQSCRPFVFQSKEQGASKEATETRVEWSRRYPEESFFLHSQNEQAKDTSEMSTITETPCDMNGFQLVTSVQAQVKFLWQVSDPKFQDEAYLQHAVDRYYKFLRLSEKFHRERGITSMIVPTYEIDLMWHTHILHSIPQYKSDCIRIRGSFLNHDDSFNDRSPGSNLEISFQETCDAWHEAYHEPYVGCLVAVTYRGEPPEEYFVSNVNTNQPNETVSAEDKPASSVGSFKSQEKMSVSDPPSTPLKMFRDIPWVDPESGLIPDTMEKAFLPVQRNHAQPKKDGYVFGKGSVGVGYYSLCTRDAYQLLCEKLRQKETVARQLNQEQDSRFFRCCFRKANAAERARRERLQDTLHHITSALEFASIQYNAAGPYKNLCESNHFAAKSARPFPLNRLLEIEKKKNSKGCTLGDVCDTAGCGGYVVAFHKDTNVDNDRARSGGDFGAGVSRSTAITGARPSAVNGAGLGFVAGSGAWGFAITDTGGGACSCGGGGCACGGCGCGGGC